MVDGGDGRAVKQVDTCNEVLRRLGVPSCTKCGRVAIRRFVPVAEDGYMSLTDATTVRFAEAPFNAYAPADDRVAACLGCRDRLLLKKHKLVRQMRRALARVRTWLNSPA